MGEMGEMRELGEKVVGADFTPNVSFSP